MGLSTTEKNELLINDQEKLVLLSRLPNYKSWALSSRQVCDLELLINGGFNPLVGFLNQEDYTAVCHDMRLVSGELWPIPITLDITESFVSDLTIGESIILCDSENVPLAVLQVESKWKPNKTEEAISVFGTTDIRHPGVNYLLNQAGDWYIGGKILGLQLPTHYDYKQHRLTPKELKARFVEKNWSNIVAFQTRNPMHRAHFELTLRAVELENANLLLHPVVGMTKPGDIDHYTRVRCYEKIIEKYPAERAHLSLLPLAMRMAGPREALWHTLIRKNYGATHFIIGRDHAGPGNDSQGMPFYKPYAAQELVSAHGDEIGIKIMPFSTVSYVENKKTYLPAEEIEPCDKVLDISGTEFRKCLRHDLEIPSWFSFPEVIEVLKVTHPPKYKQGFTIFFTGLSGAGKSTIANALLIKLLEQEERTVTLLDGDVVRKNLSSELGFSKEHRDLNVVRMGYVASEITKHRGIALCAAIAPYEAARRAVRDNIEQYGGFLEVHVSTPLDICEKRDRKGLYQKARQGFLKGFTGIDDPYESPLKPEIIIDTSQLSVMESVKHILQTIKNMGYIGGN
jgi:sulfate adenylyltransferase